MVIRMVENQGENITTWSSTSKSIIYIVSAPPTVTVTTRIITFLVGDSYKPSLSTVTGYFGTHTNTLMCIKAVSNGIKAKDQKIPLLQGRGAISKIYTSSELSHFHRVHPPNLSFQHSQNVSVPVANKALTEPMTPEHHRTAVISKEHRFQMVQPCSTN